MTPRQQLEAQASHHQHHVRMLHADLIEMMEIAAAAKDQGKRPLYHEALEEARKIQRKAANRAAAAMVDLFHLIDGKV